MGRHDELRAALDELTASLASHDDSDVLVLDDAPEGADERRARQELLEELRGL